MGNREVYVNKINADHYSDGFDQVAVPRKPICSPPCVDVKAETLGDCDNRPVELTPIRTGAVAKIPVVLAELAVRFNVRSVINLPEPAIEIKNIKKRIKVTQCMLLQDTNILFIKGFIRKNIDYSTNFCSNYSGMCGDIRHCTVDTPFECTTTVTYNGIQPTTPVNRTSSEFEYFRTNKLPNTFAEKDRLLSGDLSEFNQISTEFFNELPFCELISARIVEFDEYLHRGRPCDVTLPVGEKLFTKIEEKMVVTLTLKILQNRQIAIGATSPIGSCVAEATSTVGPCLVEPQ